MSPRTAPSLSRRAALKTLGASATAIAFVPWLSEEGLLAYARIQATSASPAPRVLSAAQYATVEAFTETLIPADDRSPGARAARVADYIDLLLDESDEKTRAAWLEGIAALDADARTRYGRPYVKLDAAEMEALVTAISRNERTPKTPAETFFAAAKAATIQGYYTSEIGIHQELRYKGNQMLPEFVGCGTEDGKDCPHCGQRQEVGGRR